MILFNRAKLILEFKPSKFNRVVLGLIYNYLQNFIQIRSLDFAQSCLLNFDVLHVRVRERVRERVHVSASKLNQYLLGHI